MKQFKKLLALMLALVCCFATTTVALAADTSTVARYEEISGETDSVQPRIGIAGYVNHYHNGNSYYGEFTFSTSSIALPMKQYTIEFSEFNSDSWIVVEIYNSQGQVIMSQSFSRTGNGKWENIPFRSGTFINGDTYTVKYNVYHGGTTPLDSDTGWIGIWIY